MTAYDSDIAEAYGQAPLGTPDPIERTAGFKDVSFQFPRVFLEPVDPPFELHKIPTELIQDAVRLRNLSCAGSRPWMWNPPR